MKLIWKLNKFGNETIGNENYLEMKLMITDQHVVHGEDGTI